MNLEVEDGTRSQTGVPGNGLTPQHQRANRFRLAMRAVRHDLSNELIVIHGNLKPLEEEADRLTPQGRDALRRLTGAVRDVRDTVAALKLLCRLNDADGTPEVVPLADLFAEVRAAVNQLYPTHRVEYHLQLEAPRVLAPSGRLFETLVQLVRVLLTAAGPGAVRLWGAAVAAPAGVALTLRLPRRTADGPAPSDSTLQNRLDVLTAGELADGCGARLSVALQPEGGLLLTLLLPVA
jgi:hypothetical protein